jgi:hypothetical protein
VRQVGDMLAFGQSSRLLMLTVCPCPPLHCSYCFPLSPRVGDTFVFGSSSRMFVLIGPPELMPEEGLNKQQRKQLALLEAAQVRLLVRALRVTMQSKPAQQSQCVRVWLCWRQHR